jgi:hypothetical protein
MGYFFAYAVLSALLFGIGIPVYGTVVIRKRALTALGITRKDLGLNRFRLICSHPNKPTESLQPGTC